MESLQNIIFNFSEILEYWEFSLGIVFLTTILLTYLEYEIIGISFGLTMGISIILKIYDIGTIPNIFLIYFIIVSTCMVYAIYKYIYIMDEEMEKLSKFIELFGGENLYLDIINSSDKIDAEYFINYYKIKISDNQERIKYIEIMNKIIIPENIKTCEKHEIINRINSIKKYIKSQKFIINNLIMMNGFTPSNSLINYYLMLISIKKNMISNSKDLHEKFNNDVIQVLYTLKNNFKPNELITLLNFTQVPNYKKNDENFKLVLNITIAGIEKYFETYSKNNMYFF
jgi:hypothetical protein